MSTKFTDITISDYTNNSIVVQGETKKYKEDLKKLGGKYNSNLKNGPGWIFPKTSEKELSSFINGGKRLVSKEEEEKANELSKQKSKEWNEKRALTFKSGDKSVVHPESARVECDDVLTQLKNIMAEMALIKKSINMILTDDQKKRLNKEEKKFDKPILENSDSEEECGIVNRKRLLR